MDSMSSLSRSEKNHVPPKVPVRSSSLLRLNESENSSSWNLLRSRKDRLDVLGSELIYQCNSDSGKIPQKQEKEPLLLNKNPSMSISENDLNETEVTSDDELSKKFAKQHPFWNKVLRRWIALIRIVVALRAILVRLTFCIYSAFAIYMVVMATHQKLYYLLHLTSIPLLIDLAVAIRNRIKKDNFGRSVAKW
ncbi:hypothetical protein Ciccas_003941 [Cichlidogyrus casuarinus]|uniref:Uncharacterized protein n=1 Tax=Cichlidogyrus casuarinus TaxID=1844966 RepID=A0ABD2QCX5_9PLAT